MIRRRSRWTDLLKRTLLRLLAVAGLLAMLPSLPRPEPAAALAQPAIEATLAGVERASAPAPSRAERPRLGGLSRRVASAPRLR